MERGVFLSQKMNVNSEIFLIFHSNFEHLSKTSDFTFTLNDSIICALKNLRSLIIRSVTNTQFTISKHKNQEQNFEFYFCSNLSSLCDLKSSGF